MALYTADKLDSLSGTSECKMLHETDALATSTGGGQEVPQTHSSARPTHGATQRPSLATCSHLAHPRTPSRSGWRVRLRVGAVQTTDGTHAPPDSRARMPSIYSECNQCWRPRRTPHQIGAVAFERQVRPEPVLKLALEAVRDKITTFADEQDQACLHLARVWGASGHALHATYTHSHLIFPHRPQSTGCRSSHELTQARRPLAQALW